MTPYTEYLSWIETQEKQLLDRVKKWVAINTFSTNIEGLEHLLNILAVDFKMLGGEAAYTLLPSQKFLGADGALKTRPLGWALVLRKRTHAPIQILLGGHYDTVFSPTSPFPISEDRKQRIYKGPGIVDMKGGLAILLTALEAFEQAPFAQNVGWEILLSPDEEIGSPGSAYLYQDAAKRHDAALLFEPSFPDGAFVSERQGSATYTVVVKGKAAHVGRDFAHGRSAVFPLARMISALDAIQEEGTMTINVADVEGKGPVNIVPPIASCRVNIRSMRGDLLESFLGRLQQIAQQCEQEGILFDIFQDTLRPPKLFDGQTQALFEAYGQCASELALPFSYRATGGVCDGNLLGGAGLPTLDTAGAIGGSLHTSDEFLVPSSLVERSKLAALFLLKLANGEITLDKRPRHG